MPKAERRSTRNSNKSGILGESETSKTGPQRSKRNSKGSQRLESERAPLVIKSSDAIVDFTEGETGEGSDTTSKSSHPGGRSVQSRELSVLSADETTDSEVTSVDGELLKLQMPILLHEHLSLKKRYEELKDRLGDDDRVQSRSESGGEMQEHRTLTLGESHPVPLVLKVDRFSNAEIRNMVESLNNDIVALCSAIADDLSRDLIPIALHPLVVDAVPAVVHITGILGRNFTNISFFCTRRIRVTAV